MDAQRANDDKLLSRIRALVAKHRAMSADEVALGLRLSEDLGMDGDDAVEFFDEYARDFQVDLTAMRWSRHFGPEGTWTPLALLWPPWWLSLLPVSVADLAASARAGRWTYEYADADSPAKA